MWKGERIPCTSLIVGVQYQYVVPQKEVFQKIVNVIKKEKLYSTLGVLKR